MLKREILDLVHDLPCSLEQDVFPALVERGEIRGREFDGYFLDIGLPETLEQGHRELPDVRVRPAAFLDRNALVDFAGDDCRRRFDGCAGAVEAIRALNDHGYYVFVTSDPSGDAQKTLPVADACHLNAATQELLAAAGAHVDRFYSEPAFAGDVAPELGADAAEWRSHSKALAAAMNEWPIVREQSFFIGLDRDDIEAARSAGISSHVFDGADLAALVHSLLGQIRVNDRAAAEPRKA